MPVALVTGGSRGLGRRAEPAGADLAEPDGAQRLAASRAVGRLGTAEELVIDGGSRPT